MHAKLMPVADTRVERPWYALLAIPLAVVTAIGAIPVGLQFLADPSGASMACQRLDRGDRVRDAPGPGPVPVRDQRIGMLVLAGLTAIRHRAAPG
jgi:hypothetical protein